MAQPTELDLFVALSRILTGEEELDSTLANQYLQRLKAQYPTQMQGILDAFAEIASNTFPPAILEIKQRVLDNRDLQPVAKQIINIWYTAEFIGADGKPKQGSQAQYYSGLLWKVIKAHAPTHSTEDYGYWQTPPK